VLEASPLAKLFASFVYLATTLRKRAIYSLGLSQSFLSLLQGKGYYIVFVY
jgi:hypothetical protein